MTTDQSDSPKTNAAEHSAQSRLLPTYMRLVRYALKYKGRLTIILLLSIVVAASLSSMILSAGLVIKVIYADENGAAEQILSAKESVRDVSETLERYTGWAPADGEERIESLIRSMRENRSTALRVLAVVIVGLSLIGGGARFLQEYYSGTIGINISIRLNQEMFANLVNLSHRFFDQRSTGEIVARFTNDAFMVHIGLMNVFKILFREPIKIIFFLGLAMSVNAYLTLMVLLVLSPIILIVLTISKGVKIAVARALRKFAALASIVTEMSRGISVVKGYQMEGHEKARVNAELEHLRRYQKRLTRAQSAVGPVTDVLMVMGLGLFLVLSLRQYSAGETTSDGLSGGDLFMLFGALAAMMDPLRKLSRVVNSMQTSATSGARVFEIIDYAPEIDERPDAVALGTLHDALRFEHVGFSYDGEVEVLHDVSFDVKAGEMVALVGFSGSGKSTLAKLVPRFYDPTEGRITLDGVDIRHATLESLRGQISIVTQETILFAETVYANIAYGRHGVSEDRVREAAEAANADEFIEAMPKSYDTALEESGGNLSGGQRQRLAIARAIVKDPAILILDEATSSLDSESEAAVLSAIDQFVEDRTTLVIAHRLSTVQKADRIVVLDGGRVAEQGTHAELLALGGIYERLYRLQFADHHGTDGTLETGKQG